MDHILDFPSPQASGPGRDVTFITQDGQRETYLKPVGAFAAEFKAAKGDVPETILLLYADFAVVTITGHDLKPLYMQCCEGTVSTIRESNPNQRDRRNAPYIETIDVRLKWRESTLVDA